MFLAAYAWEVIANLSGSAMLIAEVIIAVTWVMFVVDYVVNLAECVAAPGGNSGAWQRAHLRCGFLSTAGIWWAFVTITTVGYGTSTQQPNSVG